MLPAGVVNSLIDREWQIHLTGTELKIVRFVFQRTYQFGKQAEIIPIRHFLDGIDVRGYSISGLGVSRASIFRALTTLKDKGFLHSYARTTRMPVVYSLNVSLSGANLVSRVRRASRNNETTSSLTGETLNLRKLNMRNRNSGNRVPASLNEVIAKTSQRSLSVRDTKKNSGKLTGLFICWEDTFVENYPDDHMLEWTKASQSQFKRAVSRLPSSLDARKLIEFSVANWSEIIGSKLTNMKNKPRLPKLAFWVKLLDVFTEAYVEFNAFGTIASPRSTKALSEGLSVADKAELEALRKQTRADRTQINQQDIQIRKHAATMRAERLGRKPARKRLKLHSKGAAHEVGLKEWDE